LSGFKDDNWPVSLIWTIRFNPRLEQ
jgi:hypothetical protein